MASLGTLFGRLFGRNRASEGNQTDTASATPTAGATTASTSATPPETPPMAGTIGQQAAAATVPDQGQSMPTPQDTGGSAFPQAADQAQQAQPAGEAPPEASGPTADDMPVAVGVYEAIVTDQEITLPLDAGADEPVDVHEVVEELVLVTPTELPPEETQAEAVPPQDTVAPGSESGMTPDATSGTAPSMEASTGGQAEAAEPEPGQKSAPEAPPDEQSV